MGHDGCWALKGSVKLILFIGVLLPDNAVCQTLEQHILTASAQHGLEPALLRSIASVESGNGQRRLNAKTLDYGAFQINYKTVAAYGLNASEVYANDSYSAMAAGRLLKDLKRQFKGKDGPRWPCRYNVGWAKLTPARYEACSKYLLKLQLNGYILPVGGA